MTKFLNVHPGEILLEDFLEPLNITAYRLAKDIYVPVTRIDNIIKGKRRITADTACRLARYFDTSDQFWLNLQALYDLREVKKEKGDEIDAIKSIHSGPHM